MYEVKADKGLRFEEVKQELERTMLEFLGELGYGRAGVMVMDNWQDNKGIIRTETKSVDSVKTALTMLQRVGDQKVMVKTIGVSGILKKAKSKFLKGGR